MVLIIYTFVPYVKNYFYMNVHFKINNLHNHSKAIATLGYGNRMGDFPFPIRLLNIRAIGNC